MTTKKPFLLALMCLSLFSMHNCGYQMSESGGGDLLLNNGDIVGDDVVIMQGPNPKHKKDTAKDDNGVTIVEDTFPDHHPWCGTGVLSDTIITSKLDLDSKDPDWNFEYVIWYDGEYDSKNPAKLILECVGLKESVDIVIEVKDSSTHQPWLSDGQVTVGRMKASGCLLTDKIRIKDTLQNGEVDGLAFTIREKNPFSGNFFSRQSTTPDNTNFIAEIGQYPIEIDDHIMDQIMQMSGVNKPQDRIDFGELIRGAHLLADGEYSLPMRLDTIVVP